MPRKQLYRLTKLAATDYGLTLRYTRERWGKEQFAVYRKLLNDCVAAVAETPDRLNSQAREELQSGIRSFHIGVLAERAGYGRHVLYYRVAPDGVVEILRILHERMEVSHRLPQKMKTSL